MRVSLVIIIAAVLLASCSNKSINSIYTDMSSSEAEKQGHVVIGPSGLANLDKFEQFFEDYLNKKNSNITLTHYTDEGDPIYVDLIFDGDEISYTYDNSWDNFGGQDKGVSMTSCTVLDKRSGPHGDRVGTEYFLTSCQDDIGYSDPNNKEYFLLFIDEEAVD